MFALCWIIYVQNFVSPGVIGYFLHLINSLVLPLNLVLAVAAGLHACVKGLQTLLQVFTLKEPLRTATSHLQIIATHLTCINFSCCP